MAGLPASLSAMMHQCLKRVVYHLLCKDEEAMACERTATKSFAKGPSGRCWKLR